ncbi:MAG TPA: SDR family NAD(P)-dependent oxidoreductase [Solirubrobacteraceae bacterium]|nr:SDR family NAD(P)-dependent oxidoreductase [Solirubrobacteraceae bacterium]
MILVAGASGVLGSEVCRRLAASTERVRAMARTTSDPAAVAELRELGAEVVTADLKDPASLAAACAGAETVVSGVTAVIPRLAGDSIGSVDLAGQLALVDAAAAAGAQHFVYVSYSGHIDHDCPLTRAKRSVERHLRDSGLAYTILRPSYFMETWLGPAVGFDLAAHRVRVYGDGDRAVSWIAVADVAEAVAACVDLPAARDAALELGGPEALTPRDVVAMAEDIGGASIDVELVPVADLEAQRAAATNETEASFAALMLDLAGGDVIEPRSNGLPAPRVHVRDHIDRVLAR